MVGVLSYQWFMRVMSKAKRSSSNGIEFVDVQEQGSAQGVGGRQEDRSTPIEGGGYLDIYTISKIEFSLDSDPRFALLKYAGLSDLWLGIAEMVGFDTFLEIWHRIDVSDPNHPMARASMPQFSKLKKAKRDLLIMQLSTQGLRPHIIQRRIQQELREHLSIRHIARIAAKVHKSGDE